MTKLAMFIPLAKADAAQRLVWGFFDETPDRSREVFDYDTSKPLIEAWSADMQKASDGKSLGNIRGQHSNIAAGKLTELVFDDDMKKVGFCAKIVDDNEWKKVEEGVYTGFSPGGKYAKSWQDGQYKRYTAEFRELSIVDVPCNPAAGFTMVKADGTEEEIGFVLSKAYEPGNEATIARSEDLAKAAGPNAKAKDYVVKARADLIAENADSALAELAKADVVDEPVVEPVVDAPAAVDPVDQLNAALAKGAQAATGARAAAVGPMTAFAVLSGIHAADADRDVLTKAFADAGVDLILPSAEAMTLIGADLVKSLEAVELIRITTKPLEKGIYSISDVANSLNSFSWIAQDVCSEASWENDTNSPLPQQAMDIVNALKTFLIAMINEEVAEMLARTAADMGDAFVISDGADVDVMALANGIVDLVKADTALMEKAGARNSKNDAAKIQTIHDSSVGLGATCEDAVAKSAALAAENERLSKAFSAAVPRIEDLTKTIETQATDLEKAHARIAELEALPAPPKGVVLALSKADDGKATAEVVSDPAKPTLAEIELLPVADRPNALLKVAAAHRTH